LIEVIDIKIMEFFEKYEGILANLFLKIILSGFVYIYRVNFNVI